MSDDKVRITLKKQPLASEREEIRQKKRQRNTIAIIAIVCLMIGIYLGFLAGYRENSLKDYTKLDSIKELISDYWLYSNDYEDLDTILDDKSFYGMTYFEDDLFTTYQSSEEANEFKSSINMDFVGVGITYISNDEYIVVERVLKDSPAEKAGIQVGDFIHKVDGQSIEGLSASEIKEMVIGKEGTVVNFDITRQGQELSIDIIRGAVDNTCYAYEYQDTLILELNSFGQNSYKEMIKYLDNYKDKDKLILDLRNNTGGYQDALENIAGLFLGDKTLIMKEIDKDGNEFESYAQSDIYYDNFKEIAILINDSTASAAEVLTLALVEQHSNAYTIGVTTYGKGVVQSTFPFKDGSALKLTRYKWVSPSGKWINGKGIKPEYEVYLDDALYDSYIIMEDGISLSQDMVSEYIRLSQDALKYLGYNIERFDGYFDDSFKVALLNFEKDYNLKVDGILDKNDYEAIVSAIKYEYSTNSAKDNQLMSAIELINQ